MVNEKELIGKRLLVDITHIDPPRREQFLGIVLSIGGGGLVVDCGPIRGKYYLPPDLSAIRLAEPGRYNLVSGEVVINPDYLTCWRVE